MGVKEDYKKSKSLNNFARKCMESNDIEYFDTALRVVFETAFAVSVYRCLELSRNTTLPGRIVTQAPLEPSELLREALEEGKRCTCEEIEKFYCKVIKLIKEGA